MSNRRIPIYIVLFFIASFILSTYLPLYGPITSFIFLVFMTLDTLKDGKYLRLRMPNQHIAFKIFLQFIIYFNMIYGFFIFIQTIGLNPILSDVIAILLLVFIGYYRELIAWIFKKDMTHISQRLSMYIFVTLFMFYDYIFNLTQGNQTILQSALWLVLLLDNLIVLFIERVKKERELQS